MDNLKRKQNYIVKTVKKDNRKMLLDSWSVSGTKKEDMFTYLSDIEDSTKIFPSRTDEIQLFTLNYADAEEKVFSGYRHGASYGTIEDTIPFAKLRKYDGMNADLMSETENKSKMLILMGNDIFFTTKKVLPTLAQRAGSSTGKFASMNELKIRFHRDAGYVAYMEACPSPCNIMFRKCGNAKKIFAVFSDSYAVMSQRELLHSFIDCFEKEMGSCEVYYKIDNFNTEITLEFPHYKAFNLFSELKQDVVPGIRILMSDTGESSFSVIGTIRFGTGICYVPGSLYNRKHTKNASVEEIAAEAKKSIVPKYSKYPKKINELKEIYIDDVESTLKKILSSCGFKSSISAKVESEISSTVHESIKCMDRISAYDLTSAIIEACDFISEDTCDKVSEKLRTCSVKSIFYKYDTKN